MLLFALCESDICWPRNVRFDLQPTHILDLYEGYHRRSKNCGSSPCLVARQRRWDVVVLERATGLRDASYAIYFFESGYGVAERMGLLTDLCKLEVPFKAAVLEGPLGKSHGQMDYATIANLAQGQVFTILRGDLEAMLHAPTRPTCWLVRTTSTHRCASLFRARTLCRCDIWATTPVCILSTSWRCAPWSARGAS